MVFKRVWPFYMNSRIWIVDFSYCGSDDLYGGWNALLLRLREGQMFPVV